MNKTPLFGARQQITAPLLLTILVLLVAQTGHARAEEFPAGRLLERIVSKADSSQSYALFLPSNYTPAKKWPIIYCFDPGARGSLPVERFKEAAEKYGYIVAGSNNSRNGPGVPVEAIVNTLWEDTHNRLAIDDGRVYTAGFSGGARIACAVGYMFNGRVAGVIASGAGFPPNITPSRATPFALFGSAGIEDFNLIEINRLARSLSEAGVPNRVEVFEGRHEWLPSDLCVEAIEWMEIQAIRSGKREKDVAAIEALFKKQIEKARSHEAAGRLYAAYLTYSMAARDFKGLIDVRELEAKTAELKDSKEVRAGLKQEKEQEERQVIRVRELFTLKQGLADPENRPIVLGDLRRSIGELREKAAGKERTTDQIVARRVLDLLFIQVFEEARAMHYAKSYGIEALNLEIAALVRPENPRILYSLAKAYALDREKRKAIEALKRAFERGFKDAAEVERDRELDGVREEAEFKRLLEEMKRQ